MTQYLFPREKFPIKLEFLHPLTRAVVETMTIDKPEALTMVHIPAVAKRVGHAVDVRMIFGDGEVLTASGLD